MIEIQITDNLSFLDIVESGSPTKPVPPSARPLPYVCYIASVLHQRWLITDGKGKAFLEWRRVQFMQSIPHADGLPNV